MPLQDEVMKRMQAAQAQIGQEMPDIAPKVSVSPAGPISSLMQQVMEGSKGGTLMSTNPLTGNITYYPKNLERVGPLTMGDLLTHEMTHARDALAKPLPQRVWDARKNMPIYRAIFGYNYAQDPDEMKAWQAQDDHAAKQGRPTIAKPNFFGPGFIEDKGDIPLPPDKP